MRSYILAAVSLFAASTTAASLAKKPTHGRGTQCMDDAAAQQVATNFRNLIVAYTDELANATLTVGFTDYSDSVNTLINNGCTGPQALGSATFNSRAAFEAGQGSQPSIPFQQLNIWHTCDTVIIRWVSAQSPEQITGNIVMEAVPNKPGSQYPWLIQTVYSEFNSGAWLVDLGVFTHSCS